MPPSANGKLDSFSTRAHLHVGPRRYQIRSLRALHDGGFSLAALPFSLRIMLENALRHEDGTVVTADHIHELLAWQPNAAQRGQIAFNPERVLLQDFTGVPALVDLAAMRDAIAELGGDPARIHPLLPAELVIDHSIQVDAFGTSEASQINSRLDYARNRERYAFLRWGQHAFDGFEVVPPNTGIVHQVNLEHLARVVFGAEAMNGDDGGAEAFPDTLVGTDSHTTMVNGLGVLGWGVGGIEAEAALLGQPMSMPIPDVIGVRLHSQLRAGTSATDLVLTVTELLRARGVVGKFVEFCGPGLRQLGVPDRATISNMCPEYGATCALFPVDALTLDYLRLTGRPPHLVELVERYCRVQALYDDGQSPLPWFSDLLELDLSTVEPSVAGPRRPQDRSALSAIGASFERALPDLLPPGATDQPPAGELRHGSIAIAAITSCTNTSNPAAMLSAGLLAKNAVEAGLKRPEWVKTSLAPGSQVVTRYFERAGLTPYLDQLGFALAGYGCTTCIGNSGPLPEAVAREVEQRKLVVCAVLSGNRNFEGRINPQVRASYLMSPALVVAFALAGRIDIDLNSEPLGQDESGQPVYLRDVWPWPEQLQHALAQVTGDMFTSVYADPYRGDERWAALPEPEGDRFAWGAQSTYVRQPPYFAGMSPQAPDHVPELANLRVLAWLGDSVTTDHISPAGAIARGGPAGEYLSAQGVAPEDFNSYGSRRGNHEVMTRGTFASTRIRNRLTPELEGGVTRHMPSGDVLSIFDAAARYREEGSALLVIAGKEYGTGSSRDWAAKGPALLGVRAVLAESFERIHRSNLVGMGILPLQFREGESAASWELRGDELFTTRGLTSLLASGCAPGSEIELERTSERGARNAPVIVRIDTPQEAAYLQHGGILRYVLRQLLDGRERAEGLPGGLAAAHVIEAGFTPSCEQVDEGVAESFPASDPPAY